MSIYVFICPTCGRGSLHDNYCEDCAEGGEFGEFVPVERITELERHNELLRALATAFDEALSDEGPSFLSSRLRLRTVEALNAAIDGGALDKDGEK